MFRNQSLTQDEQLCFASCFGELGSRKKPPEKLRSRAEGIQQDNEKVLLVSNIKVDGEPIGAFGEGEFWFHIDAGYTPRPYHYTFLFAQELPSTGGNTLFSNMYLAHESLPQSLKAWAVKGHCTFMNITAQSRLMLPETSVRDRTATTRYSSRILRRGENRSSSIGL